MSASCAPAAGVPGPAGQTAPDRSHPHPGGNRRASKGSEKCSDGCSLTGPLIAGNEVSAQLAGKQPERICAELAAAGIGVRGLGVVTPSLEELFMGLTGEGFDIDD